MHEMVISSAAIDVPHMAMTATGQKSAGEPKKVSGSRVAPMIRMKWQNDSPGKNDFVSDCVISAESSNNTIVPPNS